MFGLPVPIYRLHTYSNFWKTNKSRRCRHFLKRNPQLIRRHEVCWHSFLSDHQKRETELIERHKQGPRAKHKLHNPLTRQPFHSFHYCLCVPHHDHHRNLKTLPQQLNKPTNPPPSIDSPFGDRIVLPRLLFPSSSESVDTPDGLEKL